jgi:fibronectin-binding autotransporter adhesin
MHFASVFGATRTITLKAQNTVLSFRNAVAFTGKIALDTGINTITLNGEVAGAAADSSYTATSQSDYVGAVAISGLKLDGTTASGIKYSIGSAAGATDAKTSGGGALGDNANNVTIGTTGGIASNSASGTFNRNYTFTARGARQAQALGQFKALNATSTTTFATGTLTFSGGTSDYVHFAGPNDVNAIIKLNGTITGGANLDVGSSNGFTTDATLELGTSLVSTGWSSTATLTVNNIRYGSSLANANPIVFIPGTTIDNVSGGALTVRHSAYSHIGVTTFTFTGTNPLTMTGPVGVEANFTSAPVTWLVAASTLTLAFNFTGSGNFVKSASGPGTLVLSGNNTGFTAVSWGAGNLYLNSAGAAGGSGVTLSTPLNGVLDNTSGSPVVLTATGAWTWGFNFTWGGTGDLSRPSSVSYATARTVSFTVGGTKTLKIASGQSSANTSTLNVGGGATGTLSRLHIEGASVSTATTSTVTAGYLKAGNAASLGAVGTTTAWTVENRGAIELDGGITTPGTKNGNFTGGGPDNNDGALRATTSGTNKWQGAIQIPSTAGARFKAADGATLTLDPTGSPAYTGLQGPTGSSCPVYFDAGISSTVSQDRILANTIGIVYCGNNGSSSGRVVLSKANQHTGILDCVSGTTSLTNANAAGPAGGAGATVRATARLAVEVASTYKASFPGTTKLGSSTNPLADRAKFRIGA